MSDFTLRRESITEIIDFNVEVATFENRKDERRLISAGALIGFKIDTPAMTKTQMQQYRTFFISKYGPLNSFTFTSPFDDTEYNVKFKAGTFTITFSDGFFKGSFEFERVF